MRLGDRELSARAASLRLAAFDVDGVMTDGRIILGPQGEEYKAFHVRDGYGLKQLAQAGILVAVITGRQSSVVAARMRELGIGHVHQGVADKGACLEELLRSTGIAAGEALYMGDDLPDVPAMRVAGLACAVADAAPEVQAVAAWVSRQAGGCGAVREICDLVVAAKSAADGGARRP